MKVGRVGRWMCLAVAWVCATNLVAFAQTPEPLAIEKLFAHPDYGRAELSPNTRLLGAIARIGERMQLVVIDLETRQTKPVTRFSDTDIAWFAWLDDRRLVFTVEDQATTSGEQPGEGLFAADADGKEFRELTPTPKKQRDSALFVGAYRGARFLAHCRGSDDILYAKASSGRKGFSVMRQNTRTGREKSMALGISGNIVDAIPDAAGRLRSVVSMDKAGRVLVWYRENDEANWRELARFPSFADPARWTPVGFSSDGKTMWVAGRGERDLAAIHAFDLEQGKLGEMVLAHPSADLVGPLHFDRDSGELLGIGAEGARHQDNWVVDSWERAQAAIDASLPGRVNLLSGNVKTRLLVRSSSDRDPGRYYLYETADRKLAEILSVRPDIDPAQASEMKFIRYDARDKLRIPAYLSLPRSGSSGKPPLVVLVHGGPYFVRDHWQFNPEVQFLTSRGYAVLQPQFRGSGGFGDRLFRAGWKTWGLAMQDDLSDGVKSLAEQGLIDPARVCIMGGSYGGYAALMGVAKDPNLYRCAIDFAGVSDIRLMFSIGYSDFANSLWADFGMKELIGDPDTKEAQFIATAPTEQAGRIKAPVLLAHGSQDHRVPIKHAEKMRDALKAADKPFEWHVYSGEGHGLMKAENRYAYYRAVEAFLAKHLAPAPSAH